MDNFVVREYDYALYCNGENVRNGYDGSPNEYEFDDFLSAKDFAFGRAEKAGFKVYDNANIGCLEYNVYEIIHVFGEDECDEELLMCESSLPGSVRNIFFDCLEKYYRFLDYDRESYPTVRDEIEDE